MKKLRAFLPLGFALVGAACASSPKARIVETESGTLQAFGTAKEEPDARMSALDEAQDYCKKRKQRSIFQDKDLRPGAKKDGLRLESLPIIGQAFKGDGKTQVVLNFRCEKESP